MPRSGSRVRVSFPAPNLRPQAMSSAVSFGAALASPEITCTGLCAQTGEFATVKAGWQSGHAADCNSAYAGSIPTPASIFSQADQHPASPGKSGFYLRDYFATISQELRKNSARTPQKRRDVSYPINDVSMLFFMRAQRNHRNKQCHQQPQQTDPQAGTEH